MKWSFLIRLTPALLILKDLSEDQGRMDPQDGQAEQEPLDAQEGLASQEHKELQVCDFILCSYI